MDGPRALIPGFDPNLRRDRGYLRGLHARPEMPSCLLWALSDHEIHARHAGRRNLGTLHRIHLPESIFEELIVRGYLMTEIVELGGSGALAVVISVAVQMSYHLYQGCTNGIVLVTIFAVFSIYFWKTRRLARRWCWRTLASTHTPCSEGGT
jgi:hypothetical protein